MKLTFLESLEYAAFVFVMAILVLFSLSLIFKLFSYIMGKLGKADLKQKSKNFFNKIFKKQNPTQEQSTEFEGPIYATVTDEEGNQKSFKLASIKELKEND
ncbi:MAG TPA: hypothetical protein VIL03_04110 [Clostridia bacterium]|jgi:hypothetical protein